MHEIDEFRNRLAPLQRQADQFLALARRRKFTTAELASANRLIAELAALTAEANAANRVAEKPHRETQMVARWGERSHFRSPFTFNQENNHGNRNSN